MNKVDFAEWLKEERENRHWSQRQLAKRMGISGAHVSHVESGTRGITSDFCVKLAGVLGADPFDIMRMAGIVGNSIPNKPETIILDPATQKVVDLMASIPPDQRELVLKIAELAVSGRGNEKVALGRASPKQKAETQPT